MTADQDAQAPSALEGRAPVSSALFALMRAFHGYGAAMLLERGLYPGQELILMQLFSCDHQTLSELQRALGLDHSTVSRAIRRMDDAGLVARGRSVRDGRAKIVSLTTRGQEMREPIQTLWSELEARTTDVIPIEDLHDFVAILRRLERHYAT